MREIKFRGFDKDAKRWIFGSLLDEKSVGIVAIQDEDCHVWEVDPESVGQYTGLKDSEGHEIYEGDIVKCGTGRICEVVYFLSPAYAGYDLNPVGGFDCKHPSEFSLWSDLTIIGNVYDNPELLERMI